MRALVLDGHSAAALESVLSLGRRGAQVDVACEREDCIAFHSRRVARALKQPPVGPGASDWLLQVHRERGYDLIVPSTEVGLLLLSSLDDHHPVRGKATLPSRAALEIALDKQATQALAAGLGIAVPASALIERGGAVPPCATYPVVLKSVRSRVRVGDEYVQLFATVVEDAEARERVLEQWLPHTAVQQQTFVGGHGFGIELLFEHGRPGWHFAHERLHELPLTGGGSTYRRSIDPPPDMLRAAERLLVALGWHGAAMVEFRGGAGRWHLMEINPRLWGSLALPIDCGVDFPWGLALLAAGVPLPAQPRYRRGYYARQVLYDLTWQKLNLRADHGDARLLTRPRLRSLGEWLRPLWGKESWDHFEWDDPAVIGQVLLLAWREETGRLAARLRRSGASARAELDAPLAGHAAQPADERRTPGLHPPYVR